MGSKFHPGEAAETPKIWTKTKNNRARGMGQGVTEPNKPAVDTKRLEGPRKPTFSTPRQKNNNLERQGRVGPILTPTNANSPNPKQTQSFTFVGCLQQKNNQVEKIEKIPKPPDPNLKAHVAGVHRDENNIPDVAESMVVEDPPPRQ
jgi:hypothetical protein